MQCFMGRQSVCQFPFIMYCHSSNEGNGLVGWKLVIYVDLINSIHAWSKNGPHDRNADRGSLGGWGLGRESSLQGEHAESGLGLKPQELSSVSTMIRPESGVDSCPQHHHRWGLSWASGCDFNLRRDSTPDTRSGVLLGGQGSLDVDSQSRDQEE